MRAERSGGAVMPLLALKAQWHVSAGIIPGTPMPEHSRAWNYTSADYEADYKLPEDQPTKFVAMRTEAQAYADQLFDPRVLNWVKLEWIWL